MYASVLTSTYVNRPSILAPAVLPAATSDRALRSDAYHDAAHKGEHEVQQQRRQERLYEQQRDERAQRLRQALRAGPLTPRLAARVG